MEETTTENLMNIQADLKETENLLSADDQQKLEDLATLVERFGTSAYQLYKARNDEKIRSDLKEFTDGHFLSNLSGFKQAKSDTA